MDRKTDKTEQHVFVETQDNTNTHDRLRLHREGDMQWQHTALPFRHGLQSRGYLSPHDGVCRAEF